MEDQLKEKAEREDQIENRKKLEEFNNLFVNKMKQSVFENILGKMKDLMALPFSPLDEDLPKPEDIKAINQLQPDDEGQITEQ